MLSRGWDLWLPPVIGAALQPPQPGTVTSLVSGSSCLGPPNTSLGTAGDSFSRNGVAYSTRIEAQSARAEKTLLLRLDTSAMILTQVARA